MLPQAFAKQHGSYDAISGGHVCDAFEALTGAPTETLMLGKILSKVFGGRFDFFVDKFHACDVIVLDSFRQ